ncbi:MAG: glycosyltransferase family 39 protein, partial [bacterium]|nr:glycosyltransferase family 39 protein [bacterium]
MIKKINPLFVLGFILCLGIFLRVYNIPQTLLFHFDQGYHGLAIKDIWDNKRIALLGHKTDAAGVFHGPAFYYFMLPFYLISGWNPAGVSILLAILDGFSIIFIYFAGKNLFNKNVGLLAALLYAISYSLISYSRWLSNVTPIPFFTSAMLYFLVKFSQGKVYFMPLSALIAGFIIQLNGAIGFFFTPLL